MTRLAAERTGSASHGFTPPSPGAYPPLEELGLIGDGNAAALVRRDGAIPWMCAPRFDSPPLFAALLDHARGGSFRIDLAGVRESRQYYVPDTGILVTEMRGDGSLVRITDLMTLGGGADLTEDIRPGRDELLRVVEVLAGPADLRVFISPRGAGHPEVVDGDLEWDLPGHPAQRLALRADAALSGPATGFRREAGGSVALTLTWGRRAARRHLRRPPTGLVDQTAAAWRRWIAGVTHDGPAAGAVRRSALTLKMLDDVESGSMVAAPTSSLPEAIGGGRNWDYRYAWIRDAAFSVYALRRVGLAAESRSFLGWVLDAIDRDGAPRVLYDLDGGAPPPEREDLGLEGYRGSAPVRWGNGAADQHQHDVYGEILDCAWQWYGQRGSISPALWDRLAALVGAAARVWRTPDHGIWEIRSPGRVFTYSAALCHVALDRGARIAAAEGLPGDVRGWRAEAERIRTAITQGAWDDDLGSLTEHVGEGGGLDASLLALPLRRVLPADHPRMVATTAAVAERLGAGDGLLYRYLPDESPDGLDGHEGAFLLCSFWMVDNLAGQGRLEEAHDLFDRLCSRASPLGLLPEQIDPGSGAFLGNFPQAFSHVGLISSALNLARRDEDRRG